MILTKRRRALLVAASALYGWALWWMTLRPTVANPQVEGLVKRLLRALQTLPGTGWITLSGVEFIANVVMFVPLGVLVLAWRGRWWHGILAGFALSCAIEAWQLLFLPTRVADVRDLVSNTLGAAVGVGLAVLIRRSWRRSQEGHRRHHRKVIDSRAQ